MDIVIVADFCGTFDGKSNNRFQYLAEMLAASHRVEVVTSNFCHGEKAYFPEIRRSFPFRLTMLPEPAYHKNVSPQRLWSHWRWGKAVGAYLRDRQRPDVVYCAVPPVSAAREAARYCREQGVRFVIDIQDLWPEAFQMAFSLPVVSDLLFAPMKAMADQVYREADAICAVSRTYGDRAAAVNPRAPVYTVFLGTQLDTFDRNAREFPPDLSGTGSLPKKEGLWMAYCGTLGASYDLEFALRALALLGPEAPALMVMGDGERKESLRQLAKELGVTAYFPGLLPYGEMCGLLCACDLTVNPIRPGAAQSIINKHADYAAAGLPVVSTQESPEYRALVEEYRMGFSCGNRDPRDLAEKIRLLVRDPDLRREMGRNARRCAEERFDRKRTYQTLQSAAQGDPLPAGGNRKAE